MGKGHKVAVLKKAKALGHSFEEQVALFKKVYVDSVPQGQLAGFQLGMDIQHPVLGKVRTRTFFSGFGQDDRGRSMALEQTDQQLGKRDTFDDSISN